MAQNQYLFDEYGRVIGINPSYREISSNEGGTQPVNPTTGQPATMNPLVSNVIQQGTRRGVDALMSSGSASTATTAATTQGGTTVVGAGQAIPQGYTAVGSAANGGTMVAPTATAAPAAASPVALSGIGSAGNVILPAAGAYGAYDMVKNKDHRTGGRGVAQGAASGAAIGSYFGPAGAGVGAAIGGSAAAGYNIKRKIDKGDARGTVPYSMVIGGAPLAGLVYGASKLGVWGGKSGDQRGRDMARGLSQKAGVADKDFNVALADGTKYNIGKDGSVKNYNVDFKREGAGDAVGNVQGLAHIIGAGLNEKARRDLTGELTNAALSKGDAKANALSLYRNAGFDTKDKAFQAIQQLQDQGQIDQERGNIYRNAANNLYGNPPPQKRR